MKMHFCAAFLLLFRLFNSFFKIYDIMIYDIIMILYRLVMQMP